LAKQQKSTFNKKDQYRVNMLIRLPRVILIDQHGNNLGDIPTDEARRLAREADLDLVEVSPNRRPPVCRIMDFGKFKYEQKKKKKKSHVMALKGIRIRPRTDTHDLQVKVARARKFLEQGHKVQVSLFMKGRENAHKEVGMDAVEKFFFELEGEAVVEREPKLEGKRITMVLGRKTGTKKE